VSDEQTCINTDVELWREVPDDYYAPSIHVTAQGGIGMNVGGYVVVMPIRKWHALAKNGDRLEAAEAGEKHWINNAKTIAQQHFKDLERLAHVEVSLESAEARVKEWERLWGSLEHSHKIRDRLAVLESALRRVLLYLESCGGEPHDPEVQAAQDIRQALQGEASKGGNAFNTSTPVSAESTSESKALVEHSHNTSDLLATVTLPTQVVREVRYALENYRALTPLSLLTRGWMHAQHRCDCPPCHVLALLESHLPKEPSPAEQKGDGK
jgi:hypothetical protein